MKVLSPAPVTRRRVRTPQEKKQFSLDRDYRNAYGENDKSSRRNIPRSKALAHRQVRRKARDLAMMWDRLDELAANTCELAATTSRGQRGKFQKTSDTPLRTILSRRNAWLKLCSLRDPQKF
jgi:hypothetical protein